MFKIIFLFLIFCLNSNAQTDLDDFFRRQNYDIDQAFEEYSSPTEEKIVASSVPERQVFDIQSINLTPEHFDFSFSGFVQNSNNYGFQADVNLNVKKIPFPFFDFESLEGLNPSFSLGILYDKNKKAQGHFGLDIRSEVSKNFFIGSKLYGIFKYKLDHVQGYFYSAWIYPKRIIKDDLLMLYAGVKTPPLARNEISSDLFQHLNLKLNESSVLGVYYSPNIYLKNYSYSVEYSNQFLSLNFHRRF